VVKTSHDLTLYLTDPRVLRRFWAKVDRGGPDECWLWNSYRKPPYNYGQFLLGRSKFVTASRFSLALKMGGLPEGVQACHSCDNPPCCNPHHLFVGTQLENNLDCINKGRGNKSHGEAHRDARLTTEVVRMLRELPHTYAVQKEMAAVYGVSSNAIYRAQVGRTWKHVTAA